MFLKEAFVSAKRLVYAAVRNAINPVANRAVSGCCWAAARAVELPLPPEQVEEAHPAFATVMEQADIPHLKCGAERRTRS